MNEPVRFEFSCTEGDYPQFQSILPGAFPPTYAEFAALVDERIRKKLEQVTVTKVNVRPEEFLAYCQQRREAPSLQALDRCAFLAWGKL
jgi:hypothetical protein